VRLKEAVCAGQSILHFDKKSTAAKDYQELADEIIRRSTDEKAIVEAETSWLMNRIDTPEQAHTYAIPGSVRDSQTGKPETIQLESNEHQLDNTEIPMEEALEIVLREEERASTIDTSFSNDNVIAIEDAADKLHRIELTYENYMNRDLKVAGEFNDWIPDEGIKTIQDDESVHKVFFAPAGEYQYRLVIDGKWRNDPTNPDQVLNQLGVHNSVLHVGTENEQPQLIANNSTDPQYAKNHL
jgi:hypothetical protein